MPAKKTTTIKSQIGTTKTNVSINGETCELLIKNDISWGEIKIILKKCLVGGEFNFPNFFDLLPTYAIVEGLPFDNNLVEFSKLGMSDFSGIIKEVLKVIPLKNWLENLQVEELIKINTTE